MLRIVAITIVIALVSTSCFAQSLSACDPLCPEYCLLPFPNTFWLRKDNTTRTGWRTNFAPTSMPKSRLGYHVDPTNWNDLDGFSPLAPISAFFPDVVLDDSVPRHWNIAKYAEPDAPTILLDAETGERVAHWAELDISAGENVQSTFMIWPAAILKFNHRYIVAIRNLKNNKGQPIKPSTAFRALRDNILTDDPDIELRREQFADIFTRLEKKGISRSTLQLAWDFHTGSKESITGRILHVRDDGFSRLPPSGPNYKITSIVDNFSKHIYRKVVGEMQVPLYLTSPDPGSNLVIDAKTGLPVFQRFASAPFEVLIPHTAIENAKSGSLAPILHYGHGLFNSMKEVEDGYLQEMANRNGWIVAGTNMWGLSRDDIPSIVYMIVFNMSNFRIVPDRCVQGVLNNLVLTRLVMTSLRNDPAFQVDGRPIIDNTRRFYYGNSQGGIAGNMVMASSQDLQLGVLGVPGAPYSLLLPRSVDFTILFNIIKAEYEPLDRIMLLTMFQLLWDRADPAPFTSSEFKDPLPNTPAKKILAQYGLGDAQVTWLGALTMGRSIGLQMFSGNVQEQDEELFGFQFINDTLCEPGSGILQGYKYEGIPPAPKGNIPPPTGDTHSLVRRDPRAQAQIEYFYKTGCIKNFCQENGCLPL